MAISDFWSENLSLKIFYLSVFAFVILSVGINPFTFESVSKVYDNKGNVIAAVGMTRQEIISTLGKPNRENSKESNQDYNSCFCYPVSFQKRIKTSFRRRNTFLNYLKVSFYQDNVTGLYFFTLKRTGECSNPSQPFGRIKIERLAYK